VKAWDSTYSSFLNVWEVKLPYLVNRSLMHTSERMPLSSEDECRKSFIPAPTTKSILEPLVDLEGGGRSGNIILALIRLVHYPEKHCCNILFPPQECSQACPLDGLQKSEATLWAIQCYIS